jgi:hypothetical protein
VYSCWGKGRQENCCQAITHANTEGKMRNYHHFSKEDRENSEKRINFVSNMLASSALEKIVFHEMNNDNVGLPIVHLALGSLQFEDPIQMFKFLIGEGYEPAEA